MNVVVVGAGIVGLCAARFIAEKGIEVDVYDSKKSLEDGAAKASGILSVRGLESLGIDYSDAIVNSLRGARLHAAGRSLVIKSDKVEARVVDRGILAREAGRAAEEAGVRIHLSERLGRERIADIGSSEDTILVGADGAVSNVASTFGFPKIGEYVLTYKAEADMPAGGEGDSVDIFFSKNISHGLFGWSVPYSSDHVELGLGVGGKQKVSSKLAFDMFISADAISGVSLGSIHNGHASMIPLKPRSKTVHGNVALVGDSAGQVKATTGGGIVFGVGCAKVLADSVKRTIDGTSRLDGYETAWRKAYGTDLMMHRMIHRYYMAAGDAYLGATFSIMKLLGFEGFFGRHGDMDRPMRMLKSLLTFGLVG